MFQKIWNGFLYAGQGRTGYKLIEDQYIRDNKKVLKMASAVIAVLSMTFAILAMVVPSLAANRAGYAICALFMFAFAVISTSVQLNDRNIIMGMSYGFSAVLYALGIFTGTISQPGELSLTFVVFISIVQIAFNCRPVNYFFLNLIAIVIFAAIGYGTKDHSLLVIDLLNVFGFGLSGTLINIILSKLKADTYTSNIRQADTKRLLESKDSEMNTLILSLNASDWSVEYDEDSKISLIHLGKSLGKLFGENDDTTEGMTIEKWSDAIHPADRSLVDNSIKQTLYDTSSSDSFDVEYRYLTRYHGYKWVRSLGRINRRADGSPKLLVGLIMNVDERKKEELRKKRNQSVVEVLSKDYTDVFLIDLDREISTAIKVRGQMLDNPSVHAYPYKDTWERYAERYIYPQDRERILKAFEKEHVMEVLEANSEFTCTYRILIGTELHHHQAKYFRMHNDQDASEMIVAGYRNIDDIVAAEEEQRKNLEEALDAVQKTSEVLYAVEHDELTGVYTREAFIHHAEQLLHLNLDTSYDLLLSDVEDFKQINEYYGNKVGDEILRSIAKYIESVSGNIKVIGRYSGDRFAVLYEQKEGIDEEYLREKIAAMELEESLPRVAMKCGLIKEVDHMTPVTVLCDRALLTLNSIKHKYNACIAFYDDELKEKIEIKRTIENTMHQALSENQFKVFYQPKHDAKTGKLVGAEALLRWEHPTNGFLSPASFIPVLEENGFITEVDAYVWKRTCENIKKWGAEGREVVPVSINLSKLDFVKKDFVEDLVLATKQMEISPNYLHLEITETVMAENIEHLQTKLRELRREGFEVELDDFGTGYSSLNLLAQLPLDIVKLDMSFMRQFGDEKKLKILEASINLAHTLGLKTTSEGVETQEQLAVLREMGVDTIQGYYYSKPVSEQEFEQYLLDYNMD